MGSIVAPPHQAAAANGAGQLCVYRVELTPSTGKEGVLADGSVFFIIRGQDGQTDRLTLGVLPCSDLQAHDIGGVRTVGILRQLDIGHTGTMPWQLDKVVVINLTMGHRGVFLATKPLLPSEVSTLNASALPPVDYKVEVKTGDLFGAGAGSSTVSIKICGSEGATGQLDLKEPPIPGRGLWDKIRTPGTFSRNLLNAFVLRQLPDVGVLQQIDIGHTSGRWHLTYVRVTNLASGASAMFMSNHWLQLPKLRVRLGVTEAATIKAAVAPTPQIVQAPAEPQPQLVFSSPSDPHLVPAPSSSAILSKFGNTAGPPGYSIKFTTGNVFMGGTGAQIYFEIGGINGSSGVVSVELGSIQFSRGATNTCLFQELPFVGDLLELRVGITGGWYSTWQLRSAEVTHLATGRCYTFDCDRWMNWKHRQYVLQVNRAT